MTRAFDPSRPVPAGTLERMVDLAARSPSAGKSQGWHLVVLEGVHVRRFWDVSLPVADRDRFAWPGLLDAPVIALTLADPGAYLARYREPDKAASGLGRSIDDWPAPYWTIDASFAVMTLLLAAEAEGLGALFFGVFNGASELRAQLMIPDDLQLVGAIALGWPAAEPARAGSSAARSRRTPAEIIHRGQW
jgi:nitroreductase